MASNAFLSETKGGFGPETFSNMMDVAAKTSALTLNPAELQVLDPKPLDLAPKSQVLDPKPLKNAGFGP